MHETSRANQNFHPAGRRKNALDGMFQRNRNRNSRRKAAGRSRSLDMDVLHIQGNRNQLL